MLKFFRLTQVLPTALILLAATMTLSQPVSGSSKHLLASSSDPNPDCYMQRADGTTLNLSSLCGKVTEPATLTNEIPEGIESITLPLENQSGKVTDSTTLLKQFCHGDGDDCEAVSNIAVTRIDESPSSRH